METKIVKIWFGVKIYFIFLLLLLPALQGHSQSNSYPPCAANADSVAALAFPYVQYTNCSQRVLQPNSAEAAATYFLRKLCGGTLESNPTCPSDADSIAAYSFPFVVGTNCTQMVSDASSAQHAMVYFLRYLVAHPSGGGGSGTLKGTVTYPNIPYAAGTDSLANSPLKQSGSNIIVPRTTLIQSSDSLIKMQFNTGGDWTVTAGNDIMSFSGSSHWSFSDFGALHNSWVHSVLGSVFTDSLLFRVIIGSTPQELIDTGGIHASHYVLAGSTTTYGDAFTFGQNTKPFPPYPSTTLVDTSKQIQLIDSTGKLYIRTGLNGGYSLPRRTSNYTTLLSLDSANKMYTQMKIFNIAQYPYNCKDDSITNNTPGVQHAINDLQAWEKMGGSGKIIAPFRYKGVYLFYGSFVTVSAATTLYALDTIATVYLSPNGWTYMPIIIEGGQGETDIHGDRHYGVTFMVVEPRQTDGLHNFICCASPPSTFSPFPYSNVNPILKNINIMMPYNSGITAFNCFYGVNMTVDHVATAVDTNPNIINSCPQPLNKCYWIITPTINNAGGQIYVEHSTFGGGQYGGIFANELAYVIDCKVRECNYNYVTSTAAHLISFINCTSLHGHVDYLNLGRNITPVNFINFDIEKATSGWESTGTNIVDSNNFANGTFQSLQVIASGGYVYTPTLIGAANLLLKSIGHPIDMQDSITGIYQTIPMGSVTNFSRLTHSFVNSPLTYYAGNLVFQRGGGSMQFISNVTGNNSYLAGYNNSIYNIQLNNASNNGGEFIIKNASNINNIIFEGGASSSGATIKYVDGNQAAGKVFTSDASGNGTWQNPAPLLLGTATLSGGTVTISNASVTTSSYIFVQDVSGSVTNVGSLTVVLSAGSFTIKSTQSLDASPVIYQIIKY